MKKVFIAILTLLYMGISSGIAMDIHYCMGKETGVDFYSSDKGLCDKCGMKHKKGCCGDEHKFYKLSDSHKNVSNDINLNATVVAIVSNYPSYSFKPSAILSNTVTTYSPPEYKIPPSRILNGVFRV